MKDHLQPSDSGWGRGAGRRLLAFLLALLVAGPLFPAQMELRTSGPAVPPPDVVVKDNKVELSLEQVIELALTRNLSIVLQRYTREESALGVYQALGIYDLNGTADLMNTDTKQLATTIFNPSRQKSTVLSVGASQLLPTGGTVGVSANDNRSELVFKSPQSNLLNPSYGSGARFSYSQPLLRNFGRLPTEHLLLVARAASAISRQEFERQSVLILQQVIDAYWNLVEARAQLGVAQESLGLAKDLHERNKVQVQVGTMAPLELVQSEAQIATSEENIITAQANLDNAADSLRQLVHLQDGELWDKEIVPVTDAQTDHISINLPDAVKIALDRRTDVHEQLIAVGRTKIDADFAHGQKKPQLDLSVSYGFSGNAKDFATAYSQIGNFDFPGWTGELRLTVPIQNRAARAASVIADLEYERAKVTLDALKLQVLTEVRTAARGVETAAKQIEATKASRGFQEKNLDAEKKKYENGMSTSFEITRIQNDLTQARSTEVSAIVQYRRALVEYYRATGRLLDVSGIVVADQEPAVHRFSFHNGAIEGYEPERTPPPAAPQPTENAPGPAPKAPPVAPGATPTPTPQTPSNPPPPPPSGEGSHDGL
jgi:outer membrane protein